MVEWVPTFICSKCNATKQVVNVLEEGIDPDTKNPFRIIEMDCGHNEKASSFQGTYSPLANH